MRFIRKNGRVIPIREKVAAGVTAGGVIASGYGVGKFLNGVGDTVLNARKAQAAHNSFGPQSKSYAAMKTATRKSFKSSVRGLAITKYGSYAAAGGAVALVGMKLFGKKKK
jgi:hypothetical protein